MSLRILNGERSRGSGGRDDCEGEVARAVERQRVQVLCWRDCRSSRFQQLDCRIVGAVEAMAGEVSAIRMERCRRRQLELEIKRRAKESFLVYNIAPASLRSRSLWIASTSLLCKPSYSPSQSHVQLNSRPLPPQLPTMATLTANPTHYCSPCLRRLISQTRSFTTTPTRRKHGTVHPIPSSTSSDC